MSTTDVRDVVREKYGQAALRVRAKVASCSDSATDDPCSPITSNLDDASGPARCHKRRC